MVVSCAHLETLVGQWPFKHKVSLKKVHWSLTRSFELRLSSWLLLLLLPLFVDNEGIGRNADGDNWDDEDCDEDGGVDEDNNERDKNDDNDILGKDNQRAKEMLKLEKAEVKAIVV